MVGSKRMSLLTIAQRFLPGLLGGFRRPQGREVLDLRPVRHPTVVWEFSGDDRLVVLSVARREDLLTGLAAKLFGIPATRKIELTDEISSYVWTCCDGKHTVAEIAADISRRYKLNKRQSEVSVLTFLKTLQMKQLVGIPADQARAYKQPLDQPDKKSVRTKARQKEIGFYAGRKRNGKPTK
jgi:hypothetical protein